MDESTFHSICRDYVTEKFTRALENSVVPVALGGGNMVQYNVLSVVSA